MKRPRSRTYFFFITPKWSQTYRFLGIFEAVVATRRMDQLACAALLLVGLACLVGLVCSLSPRHFPSPSSTRPEHAAQTRLRLLWQESTFSDLFCFFCLVRVPHYGSTHPEKGSLFLPGSSMYSKWDVAEASASSTIATLTSTATQ